MKRFRGEALPSNAKIAVVANDALGNYVVSTPLLQMLRAKYPDAQLHYYGGTRTEELWSRESLIDAGFALFGSDPSQIARQGGDYDLVVNFEASEWARCFSAIAAGPTGYVVGPCLGCDGRGDLPPSEDERGRLAVDPEWTAADLTVKYPFLHSGFIAEIFARLTYLEGTVPPYRITVEPPPFDVPDVLIATTASLPEKLWPFESWATALRELHGMGKTVGLLGAKPSAQQRFWKGNDAENRLVEENLAQDLRGTLTLTQVAGALAATKLVLTLDNGILHLAAATSAPIVGLFRHGIHRLWAPPVPNLTVITPGEDAPVSSIDPKEVVKAVRLAG